MEADKEVRQDRQVHNEAQRVDEEFADKMYDETACPSKELDKDRDVSMTGGDLKEPTEGQKCD